MKRIFKIMILKNLFKQYIKQYLLLYIILLSYSNILYTNRYIHYIIE